MRLVPNIPVARRFTESQIVHIADSLNKDKLWGRERQKTVKYVSRWNLQLFQKGEARKTISLAFIDFILTKLIFFGCFMLIDVNFFAPKYMIELDADVIPPSLGRIKIDP